jgi:hypothetical protein
VRREAGNPASLMNALAMTCVTQLISGNYAIAQALSVGLIGLAEERGSVYWKTAGMLRQAGVLALTGKASDATGIFIAAITNSITLATFTSFTILPASSLRRAGRGAGVTAGVLRAPRAVTPYRLSDRAALWSPRGSERH